MIGQLNISKLPYHYCMITTIKEQNKPLECYFDDSLIPIPKRRLRYSLLELCEEENMKKENPSECSAPGYHTLPIPGGARVRVGISKMDKERE